MLSQGPFSYNRFDEMDAIYQKVYESKKADKDYDGDGKVESGKDEYFGSKDKAIKKAMGKKKGKTQEECTCKEWVESLIDEGHDLSEYTWDDMEKMFSEGISTGAAMIRGGGKPKKKETQDQIDKRLMLGKHSPAVKYAKVKEEVMEHLINGGFANNPVSAEVLFNHMSDDWLQSIEEGLMPLPKQKMARQANKAYGKEQSAAAAGDQKGANKQMQRRIAMTDPSSRKVALRNKKNKNT